MLASLANFFNEHPPELQWSKDAQLLASVQVEWVGLPGNHVTPT